MNGKQVTWRSRYNKTHWFSGVVLLAVGDRALVDDNTGRKPIVVPISRLHFL